MSEQLQLNKLQSASKSLTSVLNKFHYYPQLISIGSQPPDQILDTLSNTEIKSDCVLLLNGDAWRYFDAEQDIFNHPALSGKTVFLQTLGYTNTKYNDLHYHISYPQFYFSRVKNIDTPPLANNLNYGFSWLAGIFNIHRAILGHALYTENLLDKIIFSQADPSDVPHIIQRIEEDLQDEYGDLSLPNWDAYKNLLPVFHSDEWSLKNRTVEKGMQINHTAFKDAYCNITIESEVEEYPYSRNINLPVITEKSYKAFSSRQIPLIVGARGHYAYFKDLGFEMMEDLLSAGYDDMPFLQKVDTVVSTVAKGQEFIKDFYFSHLPEIQHNYELVNSDKVDNLILQRIKDILN